MKTKELKREMLNGNHLEFSNEKFQETIQKDDIRIAEIWFEPRTPFVGYKILFNGKIIHSSKTFESFEKRLNKLVYDWKLELCKN